MIEYTQEMMDYIKSKDSKLGVFMDKYGFIEIGIDGDVFSSIISSIISQMLSNKVADILQARFEKLIGDITPQNILRINDDEIRKCGISYSKINYIKGFARMVLNDEIDLNSIYQMSDEDVIKFLTKIKGVGRWTAEMIATFSLGRLNIFSFDDVALRAGIMKVHPEFKTLSKIRFERLKRLYSPYCTVAAIYYYHVNDFEK